MSKEKIYLVKREVRATTVAEALKKHGVIYAIEESTMPIPDEGKKVGFNAKRIVPGYKHP